MPKLSRRGFFVLCTVATGSLAGPVGCGSSDDSPTPKSPYFPQSVASFDPRPNSVMLWTRIDDPERPHDDDLTISLELSRDSDFSELVALEGAAALPLVAQAAFDHTVRVHVAGLEPATRYYYRFTYERAGGVELSATGRTKTAPAVAADSKVRFGVICCQDYDDRHFHVLRRLAEEELDFVVHLGDYVYETVGSEPVASGGRRVVFRNPQEALILGGSLAAGTIGNYRDLYRTYRSDPDLQRLHERFAMIPIWDDHEFSNDCHGEVVTYEGLEEAAYPARRAAADQAWFEYMGIDFSVEPAQSWDGSADFPNNLAIHRSFEFGRHLALVMTDLRRYRPDHLVPENALPGAVFLGASELPDVDPSLLVPYVDVDSREYSAYRLALSDDAVAAELELDASSIRGKLSAPWLNAMLTTAGLSDPPPLDLEDPDLPRGYAYHQLLKQSQFSEVGARYLIATEPLAALSAARFASSAGADEALMGLEQRAWFLETLKKSQQTFKLWGSAVAFMPKRIDLRGIAALPAELRTTITLSGEDWDGFPSERAALLQELAAVENTIVLSGDLHCFLAGTPLVPEAPDQRLIELTTSSVSSTTWLEAIGEVVQNAPELPPNAALLAANVGALLQNPTTKPNPHLAYQKLDRNGCTLIEVDGESLRADFLLIDPADLRQRAEALSGSLASRFTRERFRVLSGSKELEREVDGAFAKWDPETASFRAD